MFLLKILQVCLCLAFLLLIVACSQAYQPQALTNESEVLKKDSKKPEPLEEYTDKETSMFDWFKKEYNLSPPLEGVLLKDGQPLAHTTITRYVNSAGYEGDRVDEFITDAQGHFVIPASYAKLYIGPMSEFWANCALTLGPANEELSNILWFSNKFNGELYSDIQQPLEELICEVNASELRVAPPRSSNHITTVCRWKNMPPLEN